MTTLRRGPSRLLPPRRRAARAVRRARRRRRRAPEGRRLGARPQLAGGLAKVEQASCIQVLGHANTAHPPSVPTPRDGRGRPRSAHVREGGDELVERRRGRRRGRPSASMAGMPVSSGGWCMATMVGRLAVLGQARVEPRQALVAETRPRRGRARVVSTGDEAQRTAARRVAVVLARALGVGERQREARAQRLAIVVVAAEHVHRHRQRREQLAHALVLAARCPCSVRSPLTRTAPGAGPARPRRRTASASIRSGCVVVVADVRVAQLDEEERLAGAHAVVVSGRWRPTWPT